MLRFANVGEPEAYFTQHLAKGDYYLDGQEKDGVWRGKAAQILGLDGEVKREDFAKLCQNRRPDTGGKLTPRDGKNRRVGVDMSFHCPKSVSLLYGLSGDEEIERCVRSAVRKTMQEMEKDTQVRVRKGKEKNTDQNRNTGNLVWGEFLHKTARPVNGLPDPHLHIHCYIFNASYDSKEERFKAAQLGNIRRDASYYEACFHSHLANELARLGYKIKQTEKGWEIAGLSRETLEKFSSRTLQIEEKAKQLEERLGRELTDKERDGLAAQTRSRKAKEIPFRELQMNWTERLSEKEQDMILALYEGRDPQAYQQQEAEREQAGVEAIDHGFSHCLERSSVVREKELMTAALKHGLGRTSQENILRSLDEHESALRGKDAKGEKLVTTLDVKREEEAMLAFARKRLGKYQALSKNPDYEFQYDFLNEQQRIAVQHVMTTKDRVSIIQGKAGVGKTTTIKEAAQGIAQGGHQVYTFAPTAEATKILQEDGFENAETVSRLLVDEKLQDQVKGQVIWIDEAGLVSSRMMSKVFELAEKQEARVVLSGDTRQHRSVERGDAMRLLIEETDIPIVSIDQIQRQKGTYKEAVNAVSEGNIATGFDKLESLEWVKEIDNTHERGKQLAEDYVQKIQQGRTALVVSPTHREKDRVSQDIRKQLHDKGMLQGKDAILSRQRNLNWTEAERKDEKNYEAGLQIQFTQNCPGIKRGERFTLVESKTSGELYAKRSNGETIDLPLDHADRFQVYREVDIPLTKGDRIAITQNGFARDEDGKRKRLINGMIYQVEGISESGDIHLQNGWIIDRDFGHIDHGYCTTSYKAQGKTVDHVFLAQSSESNVAASREQFYVSISRAKRSVTIYTDDKDELKRAVYTSQERLSALEMEKQQKRRERKETFTDNISSLTDGQDKPIPEKRFPPPEKTQEAPPVAFSEQKQDITEAERLTRDTGKKSQPTLSKDGESPSLEEKRKKRKLSIRSLSGVMGQYMSLDEKARLELQTELRKKIKTDHEKLPKTMENKVEQGLLETHKKEAIERYMELGRDMDNRYASNETIGDYIDIYPEIESIEMIEGRTWIKHQFNYNLGEAYYLLSDDHSELIVAVMPHVEEKGSFSISTKTQDLDENGDKVWRVIPSGELSPMQELDANEETGRYEWNYWRQDMGKAFKDKEQAISNAIEQAKRIEAQRKIEEMTRQKNDLNRGR